MTKEEIWQSDEFLNKALLALLTLMAREAAGRGTEDGSGPEASVEAILFRSGFTNKEITQIAGTKKSTVTDRLKSAGLL
jgi:hypothetical protein